MSRSQAAQTLVTFALLLPLVLLPVAAYAVQATLLATRASLLQAAVARARPGAGRGDPDRSGHAGGAGSCRTA